MLVTRCNPVMIELVGVVFMVLIRAVDISVAGWDIVENKLFTYGRCSIVMAFLALILLQIFQGLKVNYFEKIICTISGFTLGIYSFHENQVLNIADTAPNLINQVITNPFINYIVCVLIILVAGILVEKIRRIVEGGVKNLMNRLQRKNV